MLDRWRLARPIRALLLYRLRKYLAAYARLVGICLVAAGPIVGALWTWAHIFGMIAQWPL